VLTLAAGHADGLGAFDKGGPVRDGERVTSGEGAGSSSSSTRDRSAMFSRLNVRKVNSIE
jgi:hypothetical protein